MMANQRSNHSYIIFRLSRARRVVENAFGVLVARFEVYRSPIRFKLSTIRKIVLATVVLHNYLRQRNSTRSSYTPEGSIDVEDIIVDPGAITPGSWRSAPKSEIVKDLASCLGNSANAAKKIRDAFSQYFNKEGAVSWQDKAYLKH